MGIFLLWLPVVVGLGGVGSWSVWGQEVHCCTWIEDAIDGGVGGVIGVYARSVSAVNIINNGNVINQIAVI